MLELLPLKLVLCSEVSWLRILFNRTPLSEDFTVIAELFNMAIINVKLMHEFCPKQFRMGTA